MNAQEIVDAQARLLGISSNDSRQMLEARARMSLNSANPLDSFVTSIGILSSTLVVLVSRLGNREALLNWLNHTHLHDSPTPLQAFKSGDWEQVDRMIRQTQPTWWT